MASLEDWEEVESVSSVRSVESVPSLTSSLAATSINSVDNPSKVIPSDIDGVSSKNDEEEISDFDSLGDELESLSLGSNTDQSSGIESAGSAVISHVPTSLVAAAEAGDARMTRVSYTAFDEYARQQRLSQQPTSTPRPSLGRRKQRRKENEAMLLSSLERLRSRSLLQAEEDDSVLGGFSGANRRREQALSLSVFPIPEFKSNFEELFEDESLFRRFAGGYNTMKKSVKKSRRARKSTSSSGSRSAQSASDTDDTEEDTDSAFFGCHAGS